MSDTTANQQWLFISIIVPVLNEKIMVERCLRSLLDQDYPRNHYEIIVVDNGSDDGSVGILNKFKGDGVTVLKEEKKGSYAARNLGIKNAKGDALALIDADCVAQKNWLSRLAGHFSEEGVGALAGNVKAYHPQTLIERYQQEKDSFSQDHLSRGPFGKFPITGNAAYRKEIFERIGMFNEDFVCGDLEFALRFRKQARYRMADAPDAIVYHQHCLDLGVLWEQRHRYGYGIRQLMGHDGSIKPFLKIPSPWVYLVVGLFYFGFIFLRGLLKNIFKRRSAGSLMTPWVDMWSEMAFRFGYTQAQSIREIKMI